MLKEEKRLNSNNFPIIARFGSLFLDLCHAGSIEELDLEIETRLPASFLFVTRMFNEVACPQLCTAQDFCRY